MEVNESVGKSVILGVKGPKEPTDVFYGCKNVEKTSWFCSLLQYNILETVYCTGGTRYILGWGGAVRPLIPRLCLRQKSLIFLPCLRQNSDF